jgi:AAA domain
MAKGPDWNDAHRANPGAVRDALTEPDIPFDDAPAQPNGKADADPFFSWQANGEAPPKHFELIPFDKIAIDTTPAYLVKGIVPRVGLCVFWGPPKCGKSFLVFDLMMHVALGWKYRDRKVRQGPVVYCALEGCSAFKNRVEAFRQTRLQENASEVPFHLMASPLSLVADHAALIAAIREQSPNPAAVVIDTLNRSLTGSESSDEDMAAYIKAADAIRDAFNCAVARRDHRPALCDRREQGEGNAQSQGGQPPRHAGPLRGRCDPLTDPDRCPLARNSACALGAR